MLVIQHIWSRWTKASRAAACRRPRPDPAYPLPRFPAVQVAIHELRLLEAERFEIERRIADPKQWGAEDGQPLHPANLSWRPQADGAWALTLSAPWPSMLRTRWPAELPSPLIVLTSGEGAVIDWNGRFFASIGGSDSSYFYEQHRFAAAVVEGAPPPDLFLTLEPRKVIDLTTRIY